MSESEYPWLQSARIFMLDAYQYPFAPKLEFDAEALAELMVDVGANAVRPATMGKYATIQGVRFSTHPDQPEARGASRRSPREASRRSALLQASRLCRACRDPRVDRSSRART